ncbi:hypothetical protein DSLASN_23090 [Desulfoluna limicola]|uniref:EamA domain-containing protein n=1 Tax=Desulfoluna limicola TaxID=2810562 RepID=A0ABM7PHX3_9BACT|nr:DMT family transporter [Desulfoluna limicola]BCS96677.1 hypothetical protein DSLASN_23090 [Desulfoluna limicola]
MNSDSHMHSSLPVFFLTPCALIAFAGNSLLCRMALGEGAIDAASFTSLRLLSGALVLALALNLSPQKMAVKPQGSVISAVALFIYAATFSFAYMTLSTGTGALILFGAVQGTMILAALLSGERLKGSEGAGVALAFGGLVYLVFPGVTAPSLQGALLMSVSGISWGIYSLRGRRAVTPLADTAMNFALTVPCVGVLSLFFLKNSHVSFYGGLLALLSGGLASGVGYCVWYAALRGMTATKASIAQLAVPVLASTGGVIFLAEKLSLRLIISTVIVLGGVGLAVTGCKRVPRVRTPG